MPWGSPLSVCDQRYCTVPDGSARVVALGGLPASSTDAVDVVLGLLREVVVDDVLDVVHVKTTRRDVGGDHDRRLARSKLVQHL